MLDVPTPNPTTNVTRISFTLPYPSKVQLRICDVLGNTISTLSNKYYQEGKHTELYNFDYILSGAYYLSLSACGEVITKQMQILR